MGSVERHAEALLSELCEKYPLGYRPQLLWKGFRVTAGMAYYTRGEIALSRIVLDTPEKMYTTLIHEYAHLLAFAREGRAGAGHGPAWKAAMRQLGAEPVVRHSYTVRRNAKRQTLLYRCVRCGDTFSRHRRLPKTRKYVHADCGGGLRLVSRLAAEE